MYSSVELSCTSLANHSACGCSADRCEVGVAVFCIGRKRSRYTPSQVYCALEWRYAASLTCQSSVSIYACSAEVRWAWLRPVTFPSELFFLLDISPLTDSHVDIISTQPPFYIFPSVDAFGSSWYDAETREERFIMLI